MSLRIKSICFYLCLCLFPLSHIYAKDNKADIYLRERADNALSLCLNMNYSSLGAYETINLKDASIWTYHLYKDQNFSFDGEVAMTDFVKKNAGQFYKEELSLKSESDPSPQNAIFARCMEFYRSDKLKQFLKKTKP
jgi:hypothetical protein